MTPREFIAKYYIQALKVSYIYHLPVTAILAQAAHESAWGNSAPGYNFFGMTAGSSWSGMRQLLKTSEYHSTTNYKYPVIISITYSSAMKAYKYVVRRYFRQYTNAFYGFVDYAKNITNNSRYAAALDYYFYPENYLRAIAAAGYATDPNYITKVLSVHTTIINTLGALGLEVSTDPLDTMA